MPLIHTAGALHHRPPHRSASGMMVLARISLPSFGFASGPGENWELAALRRSVSSQLHFDLSATWSAIYAVDWVIARLWRTLSDQAPGSPSTHRRAASGWLVAGATEWRGNAMTKHWSSKAFDQDWWGVKVKREFDVRKSRLFNLNPYLIKSISNMGFWVNRSFSTSMKDSLRWGW